MPHTGSSRFALTMPGGTMPPIPNFGEMLMRGHVTALVDSARLMDCALAPRVRLAMRSGG